MDKVSKLMEKVSSDQSTHKWTTDQAVQANILVADRLHDFYKFLVLLSGGAIVASVTYISNQTLTKRILGSFLGLVFTNLDFLYFSWSLLLLALIFGLLRNLSHTYYLHYSAACEHLKSKSKIEDDKYDLLQLGMLVNPEDFDVVIYKKNKKVYEGAIESNRNKEKRSNRVSIACGNLSLVFFILGLVSLVAFSVFTLGY